MKPTKLSSFAAAFTQTRYSPIVALVSASLLIGLVLRSILWMRFGRTVDVGALDLLWIVPTGAANDLIQSLYLFIPFALLLFLVPKRFAHSKRTSIVVAVCTFLAIWSLLFVGSIEYFFFEEFDARLNLVAVDYLMYPTEVIGDIRSEYPLGSVVALAFLGAVGLTWACGLLLSRLKLVSTCLRRRVVPLVTLVFAAVLCAILFDVNSLSRSENRVANQLAANGIASFFNAMRTSEIDYDTYYATRGAGQNFALLTQFLGSQGQFTQLGRHRINRKFDADPNGLGKRNVVVIVEEAFGAEFSKLYGSSNDLTPRFDEYAAKSMWFRNMYASGTRTVRGLEAISASFPPIPSVSILRRPNNERIATWGSVMRNLGYHSSFIYGGYGYFDNMNYFFGNNGFEVVDRTDIPSVRFANIWGVSDEDLFDRSLDYFDKRHADGKPFFSIVMTTSNHKPFTFREGVPGVPASGGGRAAGVRYADFALGYFLDEAAKHAWFDNTVFVVLADHGARVYGKAEIPLRTYEIPMMIYSPKLVAPKMVGTLTSQIDVAPTVLGLLGLPYEAPFFGANVLACSNANRVALFNHNYDIAAYRDGTLSILGIGKNERTMTYDRDHDSYEPALPDADLTNLSVAIYQSAYELFQTHAYE